MGRPLNKHYFYGSTTTILSVNANIGSGSYSGTIIKQKSSKGFKVSTQAGTGIAYLTATDSLDANEMNLVAVDGNGGSYHVTKLTARRATVTQWQNFGSPPGAWTFITGQQVPWTTTYPPAAGAVAIRTTTNGI